MKEKAHFDLEFDSFIALADAISEMLQCPVTIENANHQLIAHSSHSLATDSVRTATIIGRRVPEHVIGALWKHGVIRQLMDSEGPLQVAAIPEVGLGARVAVTIRHDKDILGYIWAVDEGIQFDEIKLNKFKLATDASKKLMLQLQNHRRKEEEGQQNFFWQLLTGYLNSDEDIQEKAAQLGITLPAKYQVMLFQFDDDINLNTYLQLQYMVATAKDIKVIFHVRDERQFIILATPASLTFTNESSAAFVRSFLIRMKDRLGKVEGASGLLYSDYTMVEQSGREARAVLNLKKQFPQDLYHVYDFQSLGYYRYLPLLLEQMPTRSESVCLEKIRSYDREHNSGLLETLEQFLFHDSNVKDTADVLHIHTNTLNYRLKRISEIGGIDLRNTDQKITILLEMKIEKMKRS
ncbi:helix-turn-helix domain-containing protein [Paenibacillus sp. GP183]|uniref:PucR family transcriptional regulator n=1 Tax=Paenibacillus sp. GP183 TaxID=1882751 RepID=UPI000894F4FC|nr:helix-turn-helix domain-containing protein [Paenibacillus sp. GP183]SEB48802.1 DNA-binding transcriptional regulator, PucR family [Paenibacillus sp. GP183]